MDARISGHIHPFICRTKDDTLIVVFKGANVLMRVRSTDGGQTWEQPVVIATSSKRPAVIRKVKKFEVYPGTADTHPDDSVVCGEIGDRTGCREIQSQSRSHNAGIRPDETAFCRWM